MMTNSLYKVLSTLSIALNTYFSITLAIVVPPPQNERVEDPSNRDLIDITTEVDFNHEVNLARTLTCMNDFVDLFMNIQPSRVVVMVPENGDSTVLQTYLSTIQKYRGTFILSRDLEFDAAHRTTLSALIITPNYQQIEESMINLVELCSNDCRYAVVLTDIFEDSESFSEAAKQLVRILWEKKVANAAILGTVGHTLFVAKSHDFMPGKLREPSPPVLVDECHEHRNWSSEIDIFAPMGMYDAAIRIAYFEKEPYVAEDKETGRYWGLEVWILNTTTRKLNVDLEPWKIEWANETSTVEDEVKGMLDSDKVIDLVAGGILWNPDAGMDFTTPYDVVQVVWILPMYSNLSLQGLITPLNNSVWFAVCAVLLFGLLIKYLLFRDISLLEMLALIIGFAWHKQPVTASSRLLFISWVIFGYILCQFYLASLAGQLMAQADEQIETMADLVTSGLKFGGTNTHKMMFGQAEDAVNEHESDGVLNVISKNFIVFSEEKYEHQLRELMDGHNTSIALAVTLNVSSMGTGFNYDNINILDEVLASYPLAFAVWRGLPYLNQINSIVSRLIQSGVVDIYGIRAARKSNLMHHYDQNNDAENNTLHLDDIAPGFLLLVIGYLASGICFLGEVIIMKLTEYKAQETKKKKKTEKIEKMKKKRIKGILRNSERNIAQNFIKPNVKFGYYTRVHHYS